jgi:geranylgeranyl diphosphate synthase, type II
MQSFEQLAKAFNAQFSAPHFPATPATLYDPNRYFLTLGGKRIRPLLVLMGNELFGNLVEDAWPVANAVELFHNFSLIHDDIMDAATLRRGQPTLHHKYGRSTALLAGDVMLVRAYEYLNQVQSSYHKRILHLFNRTATEVCEGQQLDIDFEQQPQVSQADYLGMIRLKTSVLLAAALQMGAMLGDASRRNQDHIYAFGLNLGIAFQIQDDYLDAFGDPQKFGKAVGGDIHQNKKTFLAIHTAEVANASQLAEYEALQRCDDAHKVERILAIMQACGVDQWAWQLKQAYYEKAVFHLEEIAVLSARKAPLAALAAYLMEREH